MKPAYFATLGDKFVGIDRASGGYIWFPDYPGGAYFVSTKEEMIKYCEIWMKGDRTYLHNLKHHKFVVWKFDMEQAIFGQPISTVWQEGDIT